MNQNEDKKILEGVEMNVLYKHYLDVNLRREDKKWKVPKVGGKTGIAFDLSNLIKDDQVGYNFYILEKSIN